ncbi:hypothetical protein PR202_gb09251 [Eleusine coracana subsp. coracana]|uniref:Protein kinase domain-containing protein n=1 Tax=Eleusine coracana subsp. coracana TaxID=191504 RepID=A0AAV5EGV4_ELECO|nr:hypothetical protein PR202_gb09251 [Eleusine coracana subsp. coracana]
MEMAGAAEAATPGQEMHKGRSNTILLPIVGLLFAYLAYRLLRPRFPALRRLTDRLPFRAPACLRRRAPSNVLLPYFVPIADRLGALPYLGPIAERLGQGGPHNHRAEALVKFPGGETLSVAAILEAPGEVVAKSAHSTLYRAAVRAGEAAVLLRFVRPACAVGAEEASAVARRIGAVTHPNLVPLRAVYVGPKGEKLLVHPFYAAGSLQRFLQGSYYQVSSSSHIFVCSFGMLSLTVMQSPCSFVYQQHSCYLSLPCLEKPMVHGNLKTSNILLDANYESKISDYGLYLLLNQAATQEMLEASAAQGYKAPELFKMKDASRESDIYSLGVVLLELLAQKESADDNRPKARDIHLPVSFKNLVLERKMSDAFSSDLAKHCKKSGKEKNLNAFFELATACCSPSPSLRPNTKSILKRLEEIAR